MKADLLPLSTGAVDYLAESSSELSPGPGAGMCGRGSCILCRRNQSLQVGGFVKHFDTRSSGAAVVSEIAFHSQPELILKL